MGSDRIPDITDERLAELAAQIRPLIRYTMSKDREDFGQLKLDDKGKPSQDRQGLLTFVEPSDLRSVSLMWDPKVVGMPQKDMMVIDRLITYHSYGAPSLFKPSVAEVLAQIQDRDDIADCVGFEVFGDLDSLHVGQDGHHWTNTILYRYMTQKDHQIPGIDYPDEADEAS